MIATRNDRFRGKFLIQINFAPRWNNVPQILVIESEFWIRHRHKVKLAFTDTGRAGSDAGWAGGNWGERS